MRLICSRRLPRSFPREIDCVGSVKKKAIGVFVSSSDANLPASRSMAERLTEAVSSVASLFQKQQAEYALIGGLSVAFRGHMRATEDVDFLLHVPALKLPELFEAMIAAGCPVELLEAIRQWNTDGMLVVRWPSGVQIDLLKPVIPVFHRILERARDEPFGDQTLRVVDAEGLLLLKLIAFRPLDQEDIRGILLANAGRLDLDWVRREARLAGLDEERLAAFEVFVRDFSV